MRVKTTQKCTHFPPQNEPQTRKLSFLYHIAVLLVSLGAVSYSVALYVLGSMATGSWTAASAGISPVRWLACAAFPAVVATRGLHRKTVTVFNFEFYFIICFISKYSPPVLWCVGRSPRWVRLLLGQHQLCLRPGSLSQTMRTRSEGNQ